MIFLLLFLSLPVFADCEKPKEWWQSAFPDSIETRSTRQAEDDIDEEFGGSEESAEPEVYHWDNLYLEPNYPEVIVDPYGSGNTDVYYDDY